MRVLMTADTVGGVWSYALELARALTGRGDHAVILATMGASLNAEQRAAATFPNLTVCESAYKLEWMDAPWADVARAGDWLLDLEAQFRPDVIHLNGYAHGALPWQAPALIVGHSCVLSWWQAVKGEAAPAEWERYSDAARRGLQAVDCVIAPSEAMRAALDRHYEPLRPTQVISNGRDPKRFKPSSKEPLILSVGRLWDEAKNVALLAQIASRLSWPVYVAGEERHPDESGGVFRAVQSVHPLGKLDEVSVAAWLGRASIYALPARYEPFGLSVLEAALSGCALVLGDIPSLRENWEGAALFVPPNDANALQAALCGLISDVTERVHLGMLARERALIFTAERMAESYRAVYRQIAKKDQSICVS